MRNLTDEDSAVIHLVLSILYQLALSMPVMPTEDYDVVDAGLHRLFTFHADVRDDISNDYLAARVDEALTACRATSSVKPLIYGVEDYPGHCRNWSSTYIAICV